MAATASSRTEPRPGWVAFSDEESQTEESSLDQPVLDSSTWAEVPPCVSGQKTEQPNSWVQFDDKPWSPSPPPPSQVPGTAFALQPVSGVLFPHQRAAGPPNRRSRAP
ncbi:stonin-2-like isoform X1 [Labeo rohita]|uniref:Stonin-2-like isoform X1 n=1 Tax=Labeo rohita TaxID=84645 RepID=A0A498LKE1_LABRO|nr:stonin-2-like isoform X1 [Labeo rohita]